MFHVIIATDQINLYSVHIIYQNIYIYINEITNLYIIQNVRGNNQIGLLVHLSQTNKEKEGER